MTTTPAWTARGPISTLGGPGVHHPGPLGRLASVLAVLTLGACSDEGEDPDSDALRSAPTWHEDIAPLIVERCTGCHVEGGIAPFPLEPYEQARPFAAAIAQATSPHDGFATLSPFLLQETDDCRPRLPWEDDSRLGEDEQDRLVAWAAARAPEGDPELAAPLHPPASVSLTRQDVVLSI